MVRRIAIVGGGISGLGAAWALNHHPDRFDFRLFEAHGQIGGNAVTADMPQDDGSTIPFDISVTACIPSVYRHILLLMEQFGIELIDTKFSYSVKYGDRVYAHDLDSDISEQLAIRDCEVPTALEASPPDWLADPFAVEAAERPQPVQLHQHGDGSETGRILR